MAFKLSYNDLFPLRMINFVKKYLDEGGTIVIENRVLSQLSKLQTLDYFYPGLFVREMPETKEASFNYETCYIHAPRKQGVLSNWGYEKQKINDLEDCLLGNSRKEITYKNHIAAQSMLRRAVSDLMTEPPLCRKMISNLQTIYDKHLNGEQKRNINEWLGNLISSCRKETTVSFCTAERTDGFSFDRRVYDELIERAAFLYESEDFTNCWIWLCLGSLFGNYTDRLMKKYNADISFVSSADSDAGSYRLVSSPAVNSRPGFCGRDEYLEKIDDLFEKGNRVVFLYGISGIGKTEIVRHYAAVHLNQYDVIIYAEYESCLKDLVISEIPFETRPSVKRLLIDGDMETDGAFFKRKLDIIKKASDQKTLLIIDNFNVQCDEDLSEFLNGRYRVLITTQYDYSKNYTSLKIEAINDMDTLIDIFMNNYQGYAVERGDPDLVTLIRYCSCHTFAIVLLAHHMENSGQTAAEMLEALDSEGIASLNETVSLKNNKADPAYLSLLQMFGFFDFSEEERKVLQLMSLMPISGVPAMVFKKWAELSSTKSLVTLEKWGWITRTTGGIALHPLVQKVVQYTMPVQSEKIRPLLENVAESLANEVSWHYTKAEKEQYCLIARSILSIIKEIDRNTFSFYTTAAVILGYNGHTDIGIKLSKQLYQYCCENDSVYSYKTAHSAFAVGWIYLLDTHDEYALEKVIRWLMNAREVSDIISLDTINKKAMYVANFNNLSKAYRILYRISGKQEHLSKAAECAEKAVALSREWLSDAEAVRNRKSPAGSLLRLSDIKMELQEYDQADELIDEAYAIVRSINTEYRRHDPDILSITSRKANVLYHLGKYKESLALTEENLIAYQDFYGDINAVQADQLELKIKNCEQLGYTETAEKTKEALGIAQKIYSADSAKLQELNNIL